MRFPVTAAHHTCSMNDQQHQSDVSHEAAVYRRLALAAFLLVAVGTAAFRWLEDDWSWFDSFYFSVVAVTTVGFGDFAPSTVGSKLFAVVYILAGISIIATFLDARFKRHAQRRMSDADD